MKIKFENGKEQEITRATRAEWEPALRIVSCSPNMTLVGLWDGDIASNKLYGAVQWLHEVEAQLRQGNQIGLRIQISAMFQYGLMGFPTVTLLHPLYLITYADMPEHMRVVVLENYLNVVDPSKLVTSPADLGLLKP